MPGLKAALIYSIAMIAQRRPRLYCMLDNIEEAFAALVLILENHSLTTRQAGFAETLYGLVRRGTCRLPPGPCAMTPRQQWLSLVCLVGVPYLKAKLDAAHAVAQAPPVEGSDATRVALPSPLPQSTTRRLRQCWTKFVTLWYPYVHAMYEGTGLAYSCWYLLGGKFFSASAHLLNIQVVRATPEDTASAMRCVADRRQAALSRADSMARSSTLAGGVGAAELATRLVGLMGGGMLRTLYFVSDNLQSGLIASVLVFKVMEWWYTQAEERLKPNVTLPIPPPPPVPVPHPKGLSLPGDRRVCPLCWKPRTNPAICATSGFVFCYPCIYKAVHERGRCPVTFEPTSLEQIWKVYIDT